MRRTPPTRAAVRAPRNVTKKPRNRRKPNYKLLLKLFVATVLVSGTVSFALQTPTLTVREVQIKGLRLTERSEVELIARSALGHNILLLRTSPISGGVCKLHEVARVTIGRSFPDKVSVRVEERRPVAAVTDGHSSCMVQSDGLAFHLIDGPVTGVPVIEVPHCERIREGRKLASPDVLDALEALRVARAKGLSVAKISVDPAGDMCLNMEGGFYVKLGQPDEIARKMSVLRTALVYKPSIAREAAYIDLSCPSAPVWKPRSG